MRKVLPVALAILLGACTAGATPADPATGLRAIDRPMPALAGPTLQGTDLRPGDYRGKVTVVNVWATWCGPCRREQPELQRTWERYRDRGVVFFGVNYTDDAAAAKAWIRGFGVSYPSISDRSGQTSNQLGFVGLPDTYVIDRTGQMRYWIFGATDEAQLAGLLDRLLGEPR